MTTKHGDLNITLAEKIRQQVEGPDWQAQLDAGKENIARLKKRVDKLVSAFGDADNAVVQASVRLNLEQTRMEIRQAQDQQTELEGVVEQQAAKKSLYEQGDQVIKEAIRLYCGPTFDARARLASILQLRVDLETLSPGEAREGMHWVDANRGKMLRVTIFDDSHGGKGTFCR